MTLVSRATPSRCSARPNGTSLVIRTETRDARRRARQRAVRDRVLPRRRGRPRASASARPLTRLDADGEPRSRRSLTTSPTTRPFATPRRRATTSRSTSTTSSRALSGCPAASSTASARWPSRVAPSSRRPGVDDPRAVRRLAVRFSAPLFPGETRDDARLASRTAATGSRRSNGDGKAVIKDGRARAAMTIDLDRSRRDRRPHARRGRPDGGEDGLRPGMAGGREAVLRRGRRRRPSRTSPRTTANGTWPPSSSPSTPRPSPVGRRAERGDRDGRRCERRRPDPVRIGRPAPAERRRGGAPPRPRPRRSRIQVPPEHPGVLPERPRVLPALRGDRGGRRARALPHRPLGHRHGPAGRRRHPAQVLEPDVRRRRRRRLPAT